MRPLRSSSLLVLAVCVVLCSALPFARAGDDIPTLFDPKTTTLENGLEVVVLEDHRAPIVTHMVWYRVGAADEAPLKSGLAHFLEHLMFKGTKSLAPGEFSAVVARNGGQENAFTSYDYTAYFQNVSVDKLPLFMELEADRMQNLQLTDEVVAPELKVVLEERSQRTDSKPGGLFSEQFRAAQYLAHPYRMPVIGWRHELETLTTQDAIDWYNKYYAPNNAILIVAGDVKAEEVFALADKYYGPIPAKPLPERKRVMEPPQLAKRTVEMTDPRVREPSWRQSYLGPLSREADARQLRALETLSQILGGGVTSRLYDRLVVDRKIATSAGAYFDSGAYDYTSFTLYGSPTKGHSLDDVEAAIHEIIREVIEQGVTEAELARAKKQMLAEAVYARDNMQNAANIFGAALASGQRIEDIVNWPRQIAEVTADEVKAAAAMIFDERRSVVGRLMPEETEAAGHAGGAESAMPAKE